MLNILSRSPRTHNKQSMQPGVSIVAALLETKESMTSRRSGVASPCSLSQVASAMPTPGCQHGAEPPAKAPRRKRRMGSLGAFLLATCALFPSGASASSIYSQWVNGPPQSPYFFPISVWWQNPAVTGQSGSYPTIGAAAAGMGINIILGVGNWPEQFGVDAGELEAAKANNLYVIGGIYTPWNENTSPQSVASVLALAQSIGAQRNVIGYNMGDEPDCAGDNNNGLSFAAIPPAVSQLASYDNTRIVAFNQTFWPMQPYWWGTCGTPALNALHSIGIGSFDYYPLTNANLISYDYHYPGNLPSHYYAAKSDFLSVPNDTLWVQSVATQALVHAGSPNQPAWTYIEAGGDALASGGYNNFPGGVQSGSPVLTNVSGWSKFTQTWVGLTVSGGGLPADTKITSIIDATHAEMSAPASTTNASEAVTVTGGDGSNSDCVASVNLCVVNGNEYRPTPAQVNAEVWMSLIAGATGIEYFCHDSTSDFFCMGGGGNPVGMETQANLTDIDEHILHFATRLNAPTAARCSMQLINFSTGILSTSSSCTNGILTMATDNAAVPGSAMVKLFNGFTFLFVQSDRRSPAGATFTYTLAGLAGKTATVVYDSDGHYDHVHSIRGKTLVLNGSGQFSDVLGANGDDYQTKVYAIQ
jgi:hypothetical protein